MTVACPNCGRFHTPSGNNYCEACAAHFRRLGVFDGIDDKGQFFMTTEVIAKDSAK